MYAKCEYKCLTEKEQIPNSIYDKFETLSENEGK